MFQDLKDIKREFEEVMELPMKQRISWFVMFSLIPISMIVSLFVLRGINS